ncbi:MAG: agmatine deiminase family protein [Pirellulaceae bacterium]
MSNAGLSDSAGRARAVVNPYGDEQLLRPHVQIPAPKLEEFFGPAAAKQRYRLPAEFDPQQGLLLACREMLDTLPELFVQIVRAARPHVPVVMLVNDNEQWRHAIELLDSHRIPHDNLHFVEIPHDTMWSRDYGPAIALGENRQPIALNAQYDSLTRVDDDDVPIGFGLQTRLKVISLPIRVDGGNLLTNGRGLAITTQATLDENQARGLEDDQTLDLLSRYYGAEQVVVLEPLFGEPTAHVDMFATFVSSDTVVVGRYDPARDFINAEVLDRNAERLEQVTTGNGPLRVVRVPMPPHDDGIWRTYTNVVHCNGALLMPTYPRKDPTGGQAARDVFARLLPGHKIVGIDAERVAKLGGALHCVTMNLGPIGQLPHFAPPSRHCPLESAISTDELTALNRD